MDDWGYDAEAEVAGCEKEVARLEKELERRLQEIHNLQDDLRDANAGRWRIWEEGFKAGQTVVNGALINFALATYPKNPYTPPPAAKLETK